MSISVLCPNGHRHRVKDRYAGEVGLCPTCLAPIHVPDESIADTTILHLDDFLDPPGIPPGHDGIIAEVEKGNQAERWASRYCYLGD